ncbi:MAG: hypothetical protein ACRDJL_09535 [Actinomycetota bacterium]
MEFLIAYLPVIACGAVMFFCMRHMWMGGKQQRDDLTDVATKQEIAELREELARLRSERSLVSTEESRDG